MVSRSMIELCVALYFPVSRLHMHSVDAGRRHQKSSFHSLLVIGPAVNGSFVYPLGIHQCP
jgi:hypothetical protein